jgi:four helix bundle protein
VEYGQSRPDFISKMSIALKEASETEYWINLLKDSNLIGSEQYTSLKEDCIEIIKLLISTIKTTKSKS